MPLQTVPRVIEADIAGAFDALDKEDKLPDVNYSSDDLLRKPSPLPLMVWRV